MKKHTLILTIKIILLSLCIPYVSNSQTPWFDGSNIQGGTVGSNTFNSGVSVYIKSEMEPVLTNYPTLAGENVFTGATNTFDNLTATSFTLNGDEITAWPTGGGIDTNAVLDLIYDADSETYHTLTSAPTVTVERANGSYQHLVAAHSPLVIAMESSTTNIASQITLMVEAGTNTIGYSESNVNYLPSLPDLPTNAVGTISYWSPVGVDSWTGTLIDPTSALPTLKTVTNRVYVPVFTDSDHYDQSNTFTAHTGANTSFSITNIVPTNITPVKIEAALYAQSTSASSVLFIRSDLDNSRTRMPVRASTIGVFTAGTLPLNPSAPWTLYYFSNLEGTSGSTRNAVLVITGYWHEETYQILDYSGE